MRVTTMVPDVLDGLQQSQQALQTALQQLSTGKRVNQPSDDPSASADLVRNTTALANVGQYSKNAASTLSETQTADAALSSVVTSLNQAVSLGVAGSGSSVSLANRQALAAQLQSVLSDVVGQANSSYLGAYVFAGTASSAAPFSASATAPSGYQYNGNSGVNTVQIGDSLTTPVNVPGDQIFSHAGADVLGSLSGLVSALKTGSTAQIATATAAVSTALAYVGQQLVTYGDINSQLSDQDSFLSQETVTLTTQQNSLIAVDISVAATNLSQATLSHNAVLAAAAKVLPNTLLDYLK